MNSFISTYRSISLIMAFLMLFTSAGFAMDMHFCSGELKSVSFFGKAKTCHEMEVANKDSMKNCQHHKKMMKKKKGCTEDKDCCSNKTLQLHSDQDQKFQANDFVIGKQLKQFVVAYVLVFFADGIELDRGGVNFIHYKPPLLPKDIPVLNQSFLL